MRAFDRPGRSTAYSTSGMAATSAPMATLAAVECLKAGGNAVDAAVTASAVLCVVEPAMTGIGGDCFALIGTPDGKVQGLNASGRSARAADADWLKASGLTRIAPRSIHAITVPGAIDGWDQLLRAFGTMVARRLPGARHRYGRGRNSRHPARRPGLARRRAGSPGRRRGSAALPEEWTGAAGGRRHRLSGPGPDIAAHRPGGP